MGSIFQDSDEGTLISGAGIASTNGVYRDAFPAFRVFLAYHEVTADVTDVRVNQAGGSAERSAGGASITLLNPDDRYILTHSDMAIIGAQQARINSRSNKIMADKKYDEARKGSMMYEEITALVAAGNIDAIKTYLNTVGLKAEDFLTQDAAGNLTIADRETLVSSILSAGQFIIGDLESWSSTDVTSVGGTKQSVLWDKLSNTTHMTYDKFTSLLFYESKTVFDYPFQEGDCIFYPNDPVRIAWRDPFDARVWYWAFTGFIDSWTENQGTNKDSTITINCTDVTKMARYSYSQVNTGLLDDVIFTEDALSLDTKHSNVFMYFKELFAGYTIPEILEILFFGVASVEAKIDIRTQLYVQGMSDDQALDYLQRNFSGAILQDLQQQVLKSGKNDINVQTKVRAKITEHLKEYTSSDIQKYKDIGKIKHPKGVSFRRKNDRWGVHTYFVGEIDALDAQFGEKLDSLMEWNEIIHHRVQRSDLQTMAQDGEGITIVEQVKDDPEKYGNTFPTLYLSYYSPVDSILDQVITTIGTNSEGLYPVGCGRVFYLTAPQLQKTLGLNAIDRSMGGVSSMHSQFIDDLTLLYDLAENIEYCFYATPKGDVVFEMPFYDFDPVDFADSKDLQEHDFDAWDTLYDYESLFREAYAGTYSATAVRTLTNMTFKLTETGTNYYVVDYTKPPVFNYLDQFTVETHEQYSFSNTCSDSGVCTVSRAQPKTVAGFSSLNGIEIKNAYVFQKELIPSLGIRLMEGGMLGFITDYDVAELYLAVSMNRVNAEARNISIPTIPKFGLMVNRPIRWRKRNYSANIVSLQHSIVVNSTCDTTINLNQVRGWTGEVDSSTGQPIMKHFGGDRPYDLAKILRGGSTGAKDKK